MADRMTVSPSICLFHQSLSGRPSFLVHTLALTNGPHISLSMPLSGNCTQAASSRFAPLKLSPTLVFCMTPDRHHADKIPKWSARALKSINMAEHEARKLKYPQAGTEALLMGILIEGTSYAARFLRANGITLFKVREETVGVLGPGDPFHIIVDRLSLTKEAQRALDWAVHKKMQSGENGEVTTTHMLLGIWSEKLSAGYKVLAAMGFSDLKAKELAKIADGIMTVT